MKLFSPVHGSRSTKKLTTIPIAANSNLCKDVVDHVMTTNTFESSPHVQMMP